MISLDITIRKANADDAIAVSAILTEAARYLESIGQPLWKCNELRPEQISQDVQAGRYYLALWGGAPVGTFKYQLEDKLFWPEITDGKSAFIHRVAVRRSAAAKGVARQMLDWAKVHTQAIGRNYLRLDCAIRPKLCAVYEANGFTKHSERIVGQYHVARYEFGVAVCEQVEAPRQPAG